MARPGDIFPRELKARMDRGDQPLILDVREMEEVALAPFPHAVHIPMGEIPTRLAELDPEREVVVVCHHGIRSAQVAGYLSSVGFELVLNLTGGIDAWSVSVDPALARY
ncbi:MAG TPA: rhodanese-like domain-containing protein [Candidatus Binataceae bacterium]